MRARSVLRPCPWLSILFAVVAVAAAAAVVQIFSSKAMARGSFGYWLLIVFVGSIITAAITVMIGLVIFESYRAFKFATLYEDVRYGAAVFFFLIRWSHSISFTTAQVIPRYKIGLGKGKGERMGELGNVWLKGGGVTVSVKWGGGGQPLLHRIPGVMTPLPQLALCVCTVCSFGLDVAAAGEGVACPMKRCDLYGITVDGSSLTAVSHQGLFLFSRCRGSQFTERRMVKRINTNADGGTSMQISFGHTYAGGKVSWPLVLPPCPDASRTPHARRHTCCFVR